MNVGANLSIAADFSANSIGFAAPVLAGLEYWNYFGETDAKTPRNLVIGKAPASVVGAPDVSAGYVRFRADVNFLQTAIVDQREVTFLAVARPGTPSQTLERFVIGNFNGASPGAQVGSSLFFSSSASRATLAVARNTNGTDGPVQTNISQDPNTFAFLSGRAGAAFQRVDDKTHNLSTAGPTASPRSASSGNPYRIGSFTAGFAGGGLTDVAFAAIYSRCLTDAEIDAVYQRVRTYMATRSIAI